jgi:hypothetical protein
LASKLTTPPTTTANKSRRSHIQPLPHLYSVHQRTTSVCWSTRVSKPQLDYEFAPGSVPDFSIYKAKAVLCLLRPRQQIRLNATELVEMPFGVPFISVLDGAIYRQGPPGRFTVNGTKNAQRRLFFLSR